MRRTYMHYAHAGTRGRGPSFLRLLHDGRWYECTILHATLEEALREMDRRGTEHAHDLYHIILYTKGRSHFRFRHREVACRPGTLVCSGPDDPHNFAPSDGRMLAYREATFALVAGDSPLRIPFHELLSAYTGLDLGPVAFPVDTDTRQRAWLDASFQRLLEALATRRDRLTAHVEMTRMLAFLAGALFVHAPAEPGPAVPGVARARELIEHHYQEELSIAEIARSVHLSPGYLVRAFKAHYGTPPIAYQIALRVKAAASMLKATSLSCKQIADLAGFSDIYQFSKTFKKVAGDSPTVFRRNAAVRANGL